VIGLKPLTWIIFGICTFVTVVCERAFGSAVVVGFGIGIAMMIAALESEERIS
jgi:hypothetical protein